MDRRNHRGAFGRCQDDRHSHNLRESRRFVCPSPALISLQGIIALHAILYFSDALPFRHIVFSICCHIVYLQNFSTSWPQISLLSLSFVASCLLSLANHFLWFFYFSQRSREAREQAHRQHYSTDVLRAPAFAEVATFFGLCVWLTPLFLFLSLSANDDALPVTSSQIFLFYCFLCLLTFSLTGRRPSRSNPCQQT